MKIFGMHFNSRDEKSLIEIGVEIAGEILRVQDLKNKITYELRLAEVGQLRMRRKLKSFINGSKIYSLIIYKWDMTTIEVELEDVEVQEIKPALERVNNYFYSES